MTVIFWGKLFGMPGLLLAVPLDLLIWSIVDHFVIRHQQRRQTPDVDAANAARV